MWLIRLVGLLVILAVVLVAGLLLLPGDRVAAIVSDQVEARTGRELQISGDVRVTLWPVLGVRTGPVRLGNADWAGPEPMLTADGLSIAVSAPDLVAGTLRIREVIVRGPDLRLKTSADGRGNWELAGPSADSSSTGEADGGAGARTPPPLSLDLLRLTDARLSYAAPGTAPVRIAADDLSLRWPAADAPMRIDATLRPAADPVTVALTIARPAEFIAGAVSPLTAAADAPGGRVGFDGRADTGGNAAGRLTLDATDTGRLLAALGQPDAAPPPGMGRKAAIAADITLTADGRLSLRDLAARLDANRLTGAADVVLGAPANVVARLAADTLDLRPLTGEGDTDGAAAPDGSGWPTDPIDASALGLLNGTIHLTANRVETGPAPLAGLDATLRIDRSRAVLTLKPVSAFGGTVRGRFVANNRKGLSVAGKARADGVDMRDLLGRLAGITRLSGSAAGELEFLGTGGSVDAIMRSLDGSCGLRMGQGVISGIDLDQFLRSGTGTGGTTVFDSLAATCTIRDGDLANDDLRLKLSRFTAEGSGRIGLGARDIDYLFTPVAVDRADARRLAISVRIKGPWSGPRITPDLGDALDAEIEAKRDELERKAADTARRKLEQELDTPVETRQDAEQAVRDKLEKEAKKGLLRLLGNN